jgi:hypothetical protein
MSAGQQFYSYLWLREDGTPFYAGKGHGNRAFVRGRHHLRPPSDRARILIFPMASEMEAFESEKSLIELFGNALKGHHHNLGCKYSDKTRQRMRDSAIARWAKEKVL